MEFVKATKNDIKDIMPVFEKAKVFMAENGNPNQWTDGYPYEETVLTDINNGNFYLAKEDGELVGVFAFIIGEEPTYKVIENGNWHQDKPYGTIHRIASNGGKKGFSKEVFDYCLTQIDYLRIDTHKDNSFMRGAVTRYGFEECGIIYVTNGPRIAYDFKKPS